MTTHHITMSPQAARLLARQRNRSAYLARLVVEADQRVQMALGRLELEGLAPGDILNLARGAAERGTITRLSVEDSIIILAGEIAAGNEWLESHLLEQAQKGQKATS